MKTKFIYFLFLLLVSLPITAQTKANDCVTTGNETYSIVNISRSFTFQESDTQSEKSKYIVYINDQPVGELACRSRMSIKINSEGLIKLSMKFIADKYHPQQRLDKYYHPGPPLELNVFNGKTYYVNVDLRRYRDKMINLDYKLVSIPESKTMFMDEERFKKSPDINLYQFKLD